MSQELPLRAAFSDESDPIELLRLKGEFYSSWQDNHQADDLVAEVLNPDSPSAYVDFLSRTLRNAIKKNSLEDPAGIIEKLRSGLEQKSLNRQSRVHLAQALIDLDESQKTIQSIAALLHESQDDSEAALLVRTLTRTRKELAMNELRSFRLSQLAASSRFPKTNTILDQIQGL